MNEERIKEIAEDQLKGKKWETFIKRINEKAAEKGICSHISFELTPMCTLSCKMCYVRLNKDLVEKNGGLRSAEDWIKMAEQFRDAGGLVVLLTGGEAISRPDFVKIYDAISRMGLFITVFTNGTLISDEIVDLFSKRPPFMVGFTMYGGSEETYEKVTGVRSFQKVLAGLDCLLSVPGLRIELRYTVCKDNFDDFIKVQKIADERGLVLNYGLGDMLPVRGAVSDAYNLRLNEDQKAELNLLAGQKNAPIVEMYHNILTQNNNSGDSNQNQSSKKDVKMDRHVHCGAGAYSAYITYDGKMLMCGSFERPFSRPFEDGFKKAFANIRKERNRVLIPKKCCKCKNIDKCGTCPTKLIGDVAFCEENGLDCGFEPKE